VSLKDFRTLIASSNALAQLSSVKPKASARGRRRQLLATMRAVAADLANTPAVCRKSYVHAAVVAAFEAGELTGERNGLRSPARRERLLIKVLARVTA
jgi:DNA topoisomerase-1